MHLTFPVWATLGRGAPCVRLRSACRGNRILSDTISFAGTGHGEARTSHAPTLIRFTLARRRQDSRESALNQVAGFGRHPVRFLAIPLDVAADRIGQRDSNGFSCQVILRGFGQIREIPKDRFVRGDQLCIEFVRQADEFEIAQAT